MLLLYAIAILPVIAGAILWYLRDEVHLIEWIGASAIGLLTAFIFHVIAVHSMTDDVETWSGQVIRATHRPWWHASWWETETYSCGTAKNPRTCTRLVRRTRTYPEMWTVAVSYGEKSETYEINKEKFKLICEKFGVDKPSKVAGYRLHMDSGDPYDYIAQNKTGIIIPANEKFHFENRVKAAPSLFSYPKVPDNVGFPYPISDNWSISNRLLGTARTDFSIEAWDILNSKLGPQKFVNLIAVGFGDKDSSAAHTLEAKWVGGKKNDLVICYGGDNGEKPSWVYVFGWTEENLVKQNLQTLFLLNKPGDDLIPKIEEEVYNNYKIRNWDAFDYITVSPPGWAYTLLLFVMAISQAAFWYWGMRNDLDKESVGRYNSPTLSLRRRRYIS